MRLVSKTGIIKFVSTALNVSLSLEEFIARPEREDGQPEELIEGELIVSPAAKVWHAAIVGRLRLQLSALKQLGYMVENDFACILGRVSMPAPDLAAVSIERWNKAEDNDGWLEAQRARMRVTTREETRRGSSGGRLIPRPSFACSLKAPPSLSWKSPHRAIESLTARPFSILNTDQSRSGSSIAKPKRSPS